MTPVSLPCVAGGGCNFLTVELEEYWQSKELLDAHLQYAHPLAAGYKENIVEKCMSCLATAKDTNKIQFKSPKKVKRKPKYSSKKVKARTAEAVVKEEEEGDEETVSFFAPNTRWRVHTYSGRDKHEWVSE